MARLEHFQKLRDEGATEHAALQAVALHPELGMVKFREPSRLGSPRKMLEFREMILRNAAPEYLPRVKARAESELASMAATAVSTVGSVMEGPAKPSMEAAAVDRNRLVASQIVLGAVGLNASGKPAGGSSSVTVNVDAAAATAQHAVAARASERVARKLRELTQAVQSMLPEVSPELAQRVVERLRSECGLDVRGMRDVETVPA